MEINKSILLTTAISYTNGSPHIGHLYESILADFIKRVYQIANYDIKLLTGTDEHGKKIQSTALDKKINPMELCDMYSNEFKKMNIKINSSFDYFIRTTETKHKDLVIKSIESILTTQNETDSVIYLGEYSGYYNIREETYISESQASLTNYIDTLTNKPYEIVKEPTFYFVLNKFIEQIQQTIKNIEPTYFQDEINTRILNGLDDLSITRTTFTWGIPFPNTKMNTKMNTNISHVIYVWFDALLNYVSGKNILFENNNNIQIIHLIGKDIIWFHSVIYPAILEACGYSYLQPTKILIHGFILDKEGRKMSKTLGNTISNEELLKKYPIDAIRYYLITNTILGHDFKFDLENLINNYNNILIKTFGNLFQRLFKIIKPHQNAINEWMCLNLDLLKLKQKECIDMIENFLSWNNNFHIYNEYLNQLIDKLNKNLTEQKPWTLEINEQVKILGNILIDFHIIMCLMYPIIPSKITDLSKYLNWNDKLHLNQNDIYVDISSNINKPIAFEYYKNII